MHAVADVRGVSGEALALAQGGDECNAIAIYLAVMLMHCTIVKLEGMSVTVHELGAWNRRVHVCVVYAATRGGEREFDDERSV